MEVLVETQRLSRVYNGRPVVDDLNLRVRRGDIIGLLGPNGAGKSTSLRMLCGDLAPSSGSIKIADHDLLTAPNQAKNQLGYLPEIPPLHPDQRVDEYLHDCARLRQFPRRQVKQRMDQVKQHCGLTSVGQRLIRNLSKGFQQRVGIAQAILHQPALIILDEPTDGLDPNQIREIRNLIRSLAETAGVILSSHILSEVQSVCNQVLILHEGQTVYSGELSAPDQVTLKVELVQDIQDHWLVTLPPVASAERLDSNIFQIRLKSDADAAELASAIVKQGWGLRQLSTESYNLEQIFMQAISGSNS